MKSARFWIEKFGLESHPEGGWFSEIYRSSETISKQFLPDRYTSERSYATSIYYMLESGQYSAFHRLKTDEIWCWHYGGNMIIYRILDSGQLQKSILGPDGLFQVVVPAGQWFAAKPEADSDYSLAGCFLSPGFDFADFEFADPEKLTGQFPDLAQIINELSIKTAGE